MITDIDDKPEFIEDKPEFDKRPRCGVISGTTGGRHPQMLGLNAAIEGELRILNPVFTRIGYSGGALVTALQARQVDHEEWMRESGRPEITKHGKIGGWLRFWRNGYWLVWHGGLLYWKYLFDNVFSVIVPGKIVEPSAYVGTWCVSSHREVHIKLEEETMAMSVLCSCALQFAISPVLNKQLDSKYYAACGVEGETDPDVFFVDGGTSSALGVNNLKDIPEVRASEKLWEKPVPAIGISIDPIYSKHDPDFEGKRWYKKIMEGVWGTVKANVHQDIADAEEDRPVYLCVAETPKELAYTAAKFDASYEEIKALYKVGYEQGLAWARSKTFGPNKDKTLVEAIRDYYEL